MTTLSIDIESRSSVDLGSCGTVKYTESPDFTILLFSFSYGDLLRNEPVTTVDLTCEELPSCVIDDLVNPGVIKTAFNAFFERTCIGKYLGVYLDPRQWRCTMIKAATLGLPLKLDSLAKALKLDVLKASEGKALIKYFSVPHAITKKDIKETFGFLELLKIFPSVWADFSEGIDAVTYKRIGVEHDENCVSKEISTIVSSFKADCITAIAQKDVMVFYEPHHNPEKWNLYKHYNNTDVVVEQSVLARINWHRIPDKEQELWELDQRINERGIMVDIRFVHNALALDAIYRERLTGEALELTGLDNPNSATQLKAWLSREMPLDDIDTLRKDDVRTLLKLTEGYENKATIDRVLQIRQELSKTSIKKYLAALNYECVDGRIRGLFQFYGANRTGRWAGRGVQFQNLRRIDLKVDKKKGIDDLDLARRVVADDYPQSDYIEYEMVPGMGLSVLNEIEMLWSNPSDILSQLIRTAFIPKPGHKFLVADFSAIEARVISWLSGEEWRMEVFRTHGKIYEASASKMFKIALELITKDSPYRQKGKISELALGYQGAVNALITMGALKDKNIMAEVNAEFERCDAIYREMGKPKSEEALLTEAAKNVLMPLVKAWRAENPKIVSMWYRLQEAAIEAVKSGETTHTHGFQFFMREGVLFIKLHSGRCLAYWGAEVRENDFGEYLSYMGLNQTTGQWGRIDTYGGKLAENLTQGVSRDCLAYAMTVLDKKGFPIVCHVHDEIVGEVAEDSHWTLEEVCKIMAEPIPWAKGLPLAADGFEGYYYKK